MPFNIEKKSGASSTMIFSYSPKFAEWTLDEDIAANSTLQLPINYTVGKEKLTLTCNGVQLSLNNFSLIGSSGTTSNTVKILFPLEAGYEMTASVLGV